MKPPLDLTKLKVYPLAERASEARLEEILVSPDAEPAACSSQNQVQIRQCARRITQARQRHAAVMLVYGAHLIKNGGAAILIRLAQGGWITHLATNGAGVIHDWEFCFHGLSTENVKNNVATGTFGAWDETGRNIHLALLGGALEGRGFGGSVGQFAANDGITLPSMESLEAALRAEPSHPLAPAGAELLQAMQGSPPGRRTARGASSVETKLRPGAMLPPRHSPDRASGHRLRHHRQSSHVQRRRDWPRGRDGFPLVCHLGGGAG